VEGELIWHLTQTLATEERDALTKLIAALTRFAMLLGGFGKSWRRADHRLFCLITMMKTTNPYWLSLAMGRGAIATERCASPQAGHRRHIH
jgi:hypothetical protein